MFHSMVRGSSPAWYSRTSLYSRPAPRRLDRSSPPGWKPRRRSTGQRERRSNWSTASPPAIASGGNPVSEVDARRRESLQHALDDRLGVDARRDPLHDDDLFLEGGVIDEHLQHEAVELGFGERVGSVGLDRVLGREDDEWLRKRMGVLANRHLAFLHCLQQRRLHLGGSAVDFIS